MKLFVGSFCLCEGKLILVALLFPSPLQTLVSFHRKVQTMACRCGNNPQTHVHSPSPLVWVLISDSLPRFVAHPSLQIVACHKTFKCRESVWAHPRLAPISCPERSHCVKLWQLPLISDTTFPQGGPNGPGWNMPSELNNWGVVKEIFCFHQNILSAGLWMLSLCLSSLQSAVLPMLRGPWPPFCRPVCAVLLLRHAAGRNSPLGIIPSPAVAETIILMCLLPIFKPIAESSQL